MLALAAFFVGPVARAKDRASADTAQGTAPPPVLQLARMAEHEGQFTAPTDDGAWVPLTLDPELQHAADRLLRRAHPVAGAAIVLQAKTGRVLVWKNYVRTGPRHDPLTTPAPAASLFKLVTSAALFERSPLHPKTRVCIQGGERQIDPRHLQPPPRAQAQCSQFFYALGFSRNAAYAQLATKHLSPVSLLQMAEQLGFNAPLQFDVPATFGRLAVAHDELGFARTAAGFQGSFISPAGVAQLVFAIVNDGVARRMRLIHDPAERHQRPERLGRIMNPTTAYRLSRMMEVTVHSGTSLEAFTNEHGASYLGDVKVAGKTGTLQPSPQAPTSSWFTGFAPSRDPKLVVVVLLQNPPVWRRKANEVGRDLLRVYFDGLPGVHSPFASPP